VVGQSTQQPLPPPPSDSDQNTQGKRKLRRDKGQIRLNPRDLLSLTWIGEQYAVRLDSLQVLLGRQAEQVTKVEQKITESSTRRVLDRWKQENLVVGRKILSREPEWVWLTAHGLRQMDLPYKPKDPSVGQLRHLHLVNQIRLHAEVKYPEFQSWRGERQMRHEHSHNPKFHVPDGEVIRTDGHIIAVEIERTLKSRRRVAEIVEKLDTQYAVVWYFVTPETRTVVEAATVKARDKFRVLNLESFVK
jgi:hypothetical protein